MNLYNFSIIQSIEQNDIDRPRALTETARCVRSDRPGSGYTNSAAQRRVPHDVQCKQAASSSQYVVQQQRAGAYVRAYSGVIESRHAVIAVQTAA